jgi:hypothetical protein
LLGQCRTTLRFGSLERRNMKFPMEARGLASMWVLREIWWLDCNICLSAVLWGIEGLCRRGRIGPSTFAFRNGFREGGCDDEWEYYCGLGVNLLLLALVCGMVF